jgi:hypothetical protein
MNLVFYGEKFMVVFECPLTPQEIEMAAECVTDQWALFASY